MIKFDRVSKRYPNGKDALRRINFELPAGQLTFLTGHSGAGKSTLLKLIMMIERPTQGQVFVEGQNLNGFSTRQVPFLRRKIGMVHQNHQLLFDRSVFDNVALPLVIAGFARADIGKRVRAALDKVGLLNKEKLNPIMLSGGEQQRVGIARAVVNKPPLLLADEPTGNLDPALSAEIMDLFHDFARVGVAVLIATHDLSLIARHRHRLLTLREGRLIHDGEDDDHGA
ncbi:MAG: cell division ATP-binding protein FtsE [Alloalcanivorax venustensis]|jgi:cell division transport system ATP-binding protein|uniref:Cell division ATP-binding protein FtsE n=1 Tax=Alloalcanivorax venustensis ISO4 TaxID=1177184 RepID=A0ABS0AH82_9GAMM|nr:cell division ATP-binding protein FtsE [Alloalcanivorax venustensis]MAD71497.1 cell division ATP-binding protein FtsE [Alcanivorax sp.]MEA3260111.1 cell division ATP-binding protein FtsE [Pseudomonadota bacterium]SMO43271.1 cell division ATP-binding protein FtsE [Alcanivorax sp. DSM 26295]MAQ33580.1 cell division ATP-binding protein FtsE [Alcanivorax sp.]MBA4731463.1 cell division ATP-binding protein FtsE [Alcanivorax sp.]|tara:strand:+ start:16928 stop:17608 length:681 start_codon:yes stop_codon:yes gene_type:complete